MLDKDFIKNALEVNGFELGESSNFGDQYYYSFDNDWKVSAYCSFVGNPFAGNVNKEEYEDISISIADMIGTNFECTSLPSLEANLPKILKRLKENSDNDEILKCPKCKTRYVQLKSPTRGQKWKPFLSCSGMIIKGRGTSKVVLCDGTSKKIPALIKLKP